MCMSVLTHVLITKQASDVNSLTECTNDSATMSRESMQPLHNVASMHTNAQLKVADNWHRDQV